MYQTHVLVAKTFIVKHTRGGAEDTRTSVLENALRGREELSVNKSNISRQEA